MLNLAATTKIIRMPRNASVLQHTCGSGWFLLLNWSQLQTVFWIQENMSSEETLIWWWCDGRMSKLVCGYGADGQKINGCLFFFNKTAFIKNIVVTSSQPCDVYFNVLQCHSMPILLNIETRLCTVYLYVTLYKSHPCCLWWHMERFHFRAFCQ